MSRFLGCQRHVVNVASDKVYCFIDALETVREYLNEPREIWEALSLWHIELRQLLWAHTLRRPSVYRGCQLDVMISPWYILMHVIPRPPRVLNSFVL